MPLSRETGWAGVLAGCADDPGPRALLYRGHVALAGLPCSWPMRAEPRCGSLRILRHWWRVLIASALWPVLRKEFRQILRDRQLIKLL